jgi:hypothetical protein
MVWFNSRDLRGRYGRRHTRTAPQEKSIIPPENEETFPDEVGSEVWVYDASEGDVEDERARSSV